MSTRTLRIALAGTFTTVLVLLAMIGRINDDPASPDAQLAQQPDPTSIDDGPFRDAEEADTKEPVAAPSLPPGDSGSGFARSELGARTAAVVYLEATEDIVHMTPAGAAQAQRDVSTAGAADQLAAEVEEQMAELVAQAPQGVQVWLAPLEARSTAIGGGFEVSIWYAEVVAVGTVVAVDNWRTVTFGLVWENDTWLIDSKSSVVGPVPGRGSGLVVTPPATLVSILGAYDDTGLTPGRN